MGGPFLQSRTVTLDPNGIFYAGSGGVIVQSRTVTLDPNGLFYAGSRGLTSLVKSGSLAPVTVVLMIG